MSVRSEPVSPPPPHPRTRRGWRYVARLLVFAAFAFLLMVELAGMYSAFRAVDDVLYPARVVFCCDTPADANIPYEDVTLMTEDGLILKGWYLLPRSDASIILAHGAGGNRMSLWRLGAHLHEQGYGVLLLELRGHGESEGDVFAQGWLDIQAGVEYLRERGVEKIGAHGFSLGATMVAQAAAQSPAIRAVVLDGTAPVQVSDLPLPDSLLGWLYEPVDLVYWSQLQSRSAEFGGFARISTHDAIAQISPRPLLLIAAGADPTHFERLTAESLYANAGDHASLWVIDDVFHGGGFDLHIDTYANRVAEFYDTALNPHEQPQVAGT